MIHQLKDPLRKLSAEEYERLRRLSRSGSEPAEHVARAKALLAVAEGCNYTEATVSGWNQDPTPFEWGGKRQTRRQRRYALGASGACARRPVRRRPLAEEWRSNCQVTH